MKNITDDIEMINKISEIMITGKTGTPTQFAAKLKVSLRTFHYYRKFFESFLKPHNITIVYDKMEKTYRISEEINFRITVEFSRKK